MQERMADQINSFLLKRLSLILVTLVLVQSSEAKSSPKVKTEVFLSPKFVLEPGLVTSKDYYQIDFPRGHIALKSFIAEIVDETGNSIHRHETYLHHWILRRYYVRKNHTAINYSGLCNVRFPLYFALGPEALNTATNIPDPNGIEVGNPSHIPVGYEEGWVVRVHAIDTRGAVNRMGCTRCFCYLYNVTMEESGETIGPGCCRDGTRCKVRQGFHGEKRNLYLRRSRVYKDRVEPCNEMMLPSSSSKILSLMKMTRMWSTYFET
ncbi:hypothetical protein ACS0TY_026045 [Phlomoides rotata]